MVDVDRHVVRPRPWKLVLYLLGAAAFVAIGVFFVLSGGIVAIVIGVVAIAFFGGGLVMVALTVRGRGASQLTLTRTGIEFGAGGTVRWADVEAVGVTRQPTTMVWLRLHGYDRYLASLPEEGRREANRTIRFLKPFAHLLRVIPSMRRYADDVHGKEDELRWNRQQYGFDFGFSPMWLDRSPDEFAELLERYRDQAGSADHT